MYGIDALYRPKDLDEALDILQDNETVRPIAGGTDILVKMRHERTRHAALLSLHQIQELYGVSMRDGEIAIGPMCTFAVLAADPVIIRELPLLKTAALSMGGPQIQNVATIGGNICNGAVSADSAPSLVALDARLVLSSRCGHREVPIQEFYLGPSRVALQPKELLTSIVIPKKAQYWGSCYMKFSMREAMDISTLGCAVVCSLQDDGGIHSCAISLGTAGPTPLRCKSAEASLQGRRLSAPLLHEAGKLAVLDANPRTSWRASKEYRQYLIEELSMRAIRQAYRQAGGDYFD